MMWNLWQKAKTFNQLPSEIFGEEDSIAAWMLDSAVMWFGITIENALHERVKVKMGTTEESRPKYTLTRLLSPDFRLPRPIENLVQETGNPWLPFMSWVNKRNSGIKHYIHPSLRKENGDTLQ